MSNTKTLNEIINQPIQGSVKKLKDTPRYATQQEVNTDFALDEVVHMLHTINGRLIEIAEKLGIEEDVDSFEAVLAYAEEKIDRDELEKE